MRDVLQMLRELAWPSKPAPGHQRPNVDIYLKPLVVLAIVLLVGPEVVAVVELTTLLDLLGATLFLTAFAAANKMLVMSFLESLRRLLVPMEYGVLLELPGQPFAVALGVFLIAVNGVMLLMVAIAPYLIVSAFVT
jgi:hypothetical protein